MPSELTPGGSRPRMTQAQIRKLQKEQEEARRVAEEKLQAAQHSDEWKQEEAILADLEERLENETETITSTPKEAGNIQETKKELSLWQKVLQFFKNLINNFRN